MNFLLYLVYYTRYLILSTPETIVGAQEVYIAKPFVSAKVYTFISTYQKDSFLRSVQTKCNNLCIEAVDNIKQYHRFIISYKDSNSSIPTELQFVLIDVINSIPLNQTELKFPKESLCNLIIKYINECKPSITRDDIINILIKLNSLRDQIIKEGIYIDNLLKPLSRNIIDRWTEEEQGMRPLTQMKESSDLIHLKEPQHLGEDENKPNMLRTIKYNALRDLGTFQKCMVDRYSGFP